VSLVGEHVEDPTRGRHRIDAVPRHPALLAGLDRDAQERAVGHPLERGTGLGRQARDQGRGEGRLRGHDHLAGAHRAAAVLDD
jgi:hypothetical protein